MQRQLARSNCMCRGRPQGKAECMGQEQTYCKTGRSRPMHRQGAEGACTTKRTPAVTSSTA
eukprot:3674290-Alexandrium_andersonii.AAC.1